MVWLAQGLLNFFGVVALAHLAAGSVGLQERDWILWGEEVSIRDPLGMLSHILPVYLSTNYILWASVSVFFFKS